MTAPPSPFGKIPNFKRRYGIENEQTHELLCIDYLNGTNIYKYQILGKEF
jgi:hypothetical protein